MHSMQCVPVDAIYAEHLLLILTIQCQEVIVLETPLRHTILVQNLKDVEARA